MVIDYKSVYFIKKYRLNKKEMKKNGHLENIIQITKVSTYLYQEIYL